MKNFFLIGFMGCGKTYNGKLLAKKIGFDFFDMDDEIEDKSGKSIKEIFNKYGEQYFRKYEREVLLELSKKKHSVVATGGGTPCFFDNIDIINNSGISFYLKCSADFLSDRLIKMKNQRPLIASKKDKNELKKYIDDLLNNREPFYLKSTHILEAENINIENIVSIVKDYCR